MRRQRGRGDRGTKANDRILKKPGDFQKARRRESFAKRVNLVPDATKRNALLGILHS